jgi:hypothetical protein
MDSTGSEGVSTVQGELTFGFKWERGICQDFQEGVMGGDDHEL